jgi:hypothetical protein
MEDPSIDLRQPGGRALPRFDRCRNGPSRAEPSILSESGWDSGLALAAWEDIRPLARNEWICWIESAKKRLRASLWLVFGCRRVFHSGWLFARFGTLNAFKANRVPQLYNCVSAPQKSHFAISSVHSASAAPSYFDVARTAKWNPRTVERSTLTAFLSLRFNRT